MKPTFALRSFLLGSSISLALATPSAFAGNTWDGGAGSGLWNAGNNWNADGTPATGVALTFAGDIQNSTSNDLAATDPSFAGILFTNSGAVNNTNAFTLAGSRITLGGNITTTANTAGATITDIISLNMILDGNRTITTNQQSASVQHNLTINGIISEDVAGRSLIKAGAGTLTLSGANTYTGATSITGGARWSLLRLTTSPMPIPWDNHPPLRPTCSSGTPPRSNTPQAARPARIAPSHSTTEPQTAIISL